MDAGRSPASLEVRRHARGQGSSGRCPRVILWHARSPEPMKPNQDGSSNTSSLVRQAIGLHRAPDGIANRSGRTRIQFCSAGRFASLRAVAAGPGRDRGLLLPARPDLFRCAGIPGGQITTQLGTNSP
jgi:hypothetical protein